MCHYISIYFLIVFFFFFNMNFILYNFFFIVYFSVNLIITLYTIYNINTFFFIHILSWLRYDKISRKNKKPSKKK